MPRLLLRFLIIFACCLLISSCSDEPESNTQIIQNPKNRIENYSYEFNKVTIQDPYHWIGTGIDSKTPDFQEWLDEQNELSDLYFANDSYESFIEQMRDSIPVDNYVWGAKLNYWYFFATREEKNGETHWVLKKFNILNNKFISYSLNVNHLDTIVDYKLSPNGRFFTFLLKSSGDEFQWRIYDTASHKYFPRTLPRLKSKTNLQWLNQYEFLYSQASKISVANIFSSPELDITIFESEPKEEEKKNNNELISVISAELTADNQYLIVSEHNQNAANRYIVKSYKSNKQKTQTIISKINADFKFLANINSKLYFLTNLSASRNRIISIDLERPTRRHWKEVVAQSKSLLIDAQIFNNKWLLSYKENTRTKLYISKLNGLNIEPISTNDSSDYRLLSNNDDLIIKNSSPLFAVSNLVNPGRIAQLNEKNSTLSPVIKIKALTSTPKSTLEVPLENQVHFFRSIDGSRVPISLYSKGKIKRNSAVIIIANDGNGDLFSNKFNPLLNYFISKGGIIAVVHARGGSTYGNNWYHAARGANRLKISEDLVSAQNWLFDKNYTSSDKLAIYANKYNAESFSLFLNNPEADVKAAIFPQSNFDLFSKAKKAPISESDVKWRDTYNYSPTEKATKILIDLDPISNIKTKKYPATLIKAYSSNKDELKYLAKLQNHQTANNPILWLNTENGSGYEKSLFFIINELGL